jgi:hypothetical protein
MACGVYFIRNPQFVNHQGCFGFGGFSSVVGFIEIWMLWRLYRQSIQISNSSPSTVSGEGVRGWG